MKMEGGASVEEDSLPKPNPKRIYNTVGFRKRKRFLSRHKKGQQKQTTYDFSSSRAAIGIPNANAQIFMLPIPSRLLLPLWVTINSAQPSESYKGECKEEEELFEKGI